MSDYSKSSSNEDWLSDSIYSNESLESDRKGEVIDMSRWRDKSMTKVVLKKGKGWSTPMNGDEVSVHYVAKREDGTVFDSTRDRNQVFTFTVGRKQVVKGLDIAIKTMKWSEISKFMFSGEYAFSESDCPPSVSPRAVITYEVQLFYFKVIDLTKKKDGGLRKRIIEPGVGYDWAIFGSKCNVHIIGKYEDKVFEERDVIFTVGEASEEGVIDGIDIAITKMRKQEKCLLFVGPDYAFGSKGKPEFGIPQDYKQVVYEITLNEFTEEREVFELTDKEKLQTSEAMKTKANNYFNQNKYRLAVNLYKRMVKVLKHDSRKEFQIEITSDMSREEFESQRDKLLFISYQNLSNCFEKLEDFSESLQWIDLALKLDPENAKALYRRGKAYHSLQEYELARDDFRKSLQFDPNNKSTNNFIIVCDNAIKTRNQSERQMFGNLFQSKEKIKTEKKVTLKETGDVDGDQQSDSAQEVKPKEDSTQD